MLFVVYLFVSLYLDQLLSSYVVEKGRRRGRKEQRRRRKRRKEVLEDGVCCSRLCICVLIYACTSSLCIETVSCHSAHRQAAHQNQHERKEEEEEEEQCHQSPGGELKRERDQTAEKARVSIWLLLNAAIIVIHCDEQC
jgi:Ca2+/H+ antiporter